MARMRRGKSDPTSVFSLDRALEQIEADLWRLTEQDHKEHAALVSPETGEVIASGDGEEDFMPRIGPESHAGLIYTHTHPPAPDLPLSRTDVNKASREKLHSIRAVTSSYVESLRPRTDWPEDSLAIDDRWRQIHPGHLEAYWSSPEYAEFKQQHGYDDWLMASDHREGWAREQTLPRLADDFDLEYQRIPR